MGMPQRRRRVELCGFAHHEVTGEALGTFHYDGPRAVAHQAFEHLREARALAYRIRAADRCVVERLRDLVTRSLGVGFNGGALAFSLSFSAPCGSEVRR